MDIISDKFDDEGHRSRLPGWEMLCFGQFYSLVLGLAYGVMS